MDRVTTEAIISVVITIILITVEIITIIITEVTISEASTTTEASINAVEEVKEERTDIKGEVSISKIRTNNSKTRLVLLRWEICQTTMKT